MANDGREFSWRAREGLYKICDPDDNVITSTLDGGKRCLDVNLGASDVSIGGGTQYAEGDTTDPATGNVLLGRNPSSELKAAQMNASDVLLVDGSGVTQPISAASLPLPTGAATSALQTSGNSTLVAINSKIDACDTDDVTIGAALPAGSNNIGDVDVASIAAGDNNIGNVDIVTMPDVTISEPDYSVVRANRTNSTDHEIVAAGGASVYTYIKFIQVINNDDTDMIFELEDAGTILPKQYVPAFGGQIVLEFPGKGLKQTAANDGVDFDVISAGSTPDFSYVVFYYQE